MLPEHESTASPLESEDDLRAKNTREVNQEVYLELLREGNSPVEAASMIGIGRTTGWRWRQDPVFNAKCVEARKVAIGDLENEAHRRAMQGSDKLLMFLLQAQAPEKYNLAQKIEHSGAVDVVSVLQEARQRSGLV